MCLAPQRRALFRHLNFQMRSEREMFLAFFIFFHLHMRFAPQRRALFRHRNFQKWSGPGVFCTFWLPNVLRATTACNLSSLIWPDGSARRFSEPTFRPSGATNHSKNGVFRDFPTFSRICIFFLLTLSLLWSSLFYSSLLSDSSHLWFSSVHIVGSLTSKLPSIITIIIIVLLLNHLFFPLMNSRSSRAIVTWIPKILGVNLGWAQ